MIAPRPRPRAASRPASLTWRYARGDLTRRPVVTLSLSALLVLGALLLSTGTIVAERLVGSVDQLFAEAKPPDFLQMHSGDYDRAALERFAAEQEGIADWTVVPLIGFDGAALSWERPGTDDSGDLSDHLVDHLFVAQNEDFDLLLDETGRAPRPADGEVYLPLGYQRSTGIEVGDLLGVRTDSGVEQLRVVGFVRDAQMASSLSASTRFLVSPAQRDALAAAGGGDREIIVEYRVTDPSRIGPLQRAYERDAALPQNGPAVTGDMIRLINALSDGLVAAALVVASALLMLIALITLRTVIRGSIQDQVRQIGALMAIGLPAREIRRLLLARYRVLSIAGCVLGGLLSIGVAALLTGGVTASYVTTPITPWTVLLPLLALALVHAVVVGTCAWMLRRLRRIDVVTSLVHGSTLTPAQTLRAERRSARRARGARLDRGATGVSVRLVLRDLRAQLGQWSLLTAVFLLAAVLMILPTNLLTTFESPRIITALGAPRSDLRADLQFTADLGAQREALTTAFAEDPRIESVQVFGNVLARTPTDEGTEILRVEVGDHSTTGLDHVSGTAPADGEIALSVLNAEKLGLGTGDTLDLQLGGSMRTLRISGVYQDVTAGGYTAKLQGAPPADAISYVVYAEAAGGQDTLALAAEYRDLFPEAGVIQMDDYLAQTLAHITVGLRTTTTVAVAFALGVCLLVTCLFLSLQLARDRRRAGVLAALGFTARELSGQVLAKTLLMAAAGAVAGTAAAALLGPPLVRTVLAVAGLGIVDLDLSPQPALVLGLYPLALLGVAALGAVLLTASLRRPDKSAWLT